MTVSGKNKDKKGAEMVATLYDASLDEFTTHSWTDVLIEGELIDKPSYNSEYGRYWNYGSNFMSVNSTAIAWYYESSNYETYYKSYQSLLSPQSLMNDIWGRYYATAGITKGDIKHMPVRNTTDFASTSVGAYRSKSGGGDIAGARSAGSLYIIDGVQVNGAHDQALSEVALRVTPGVVFTPNSDGAKSAASVQIRKNLAETAFFYPQLRTDAEGNIKIEFTMPEALTEWKLMGFAHTKDMKYGMLEGRVKTQKNLMVVPGLPRFLRQGDDMVLTTKINNLSDKELNGKAELQILDAQTLKPLNIPFRIKESVTSLKLWQDRAPLRAGIYMCLKACMNLWWCV
jgi:hypothetical protein